MAAMDVVASEFWMEEIDLADETVLRQMVEAIDGILGVTERFPINVLTAEQWQIAVERLVPPRLRHGLIRHFHVLPDPRTPGQVFVGPSTLSGLNEGSRPITAEVVYAVIQARLLAVPPLIARGLSDIVAGEVSQRIDVPFFAHNYAAEAAFVTLVIEALQREYGYSREEWVREWAREPRRCLLALRRGAFGDAWVAAASAHVEINAQLDTSRKREALARMIAEPGVGVNDELVRMTEHCLRTFLDKEPT